MPSGVAMMLEQLGAQPGDNVLEIGAGTGYHAALLAELVGRGRGTTVDIDPDVALHARATLNATGYDRVTVIERDGLLSAPEKAPYDKTIATVGVGTSPSPGGTSWWTAGAWYCRCGGADGPVRSP
ncbi:protein-L-isoaspartate O-methyltransferase [Streptomyces sp. NPDC087226]|uniref:protein-L-isoaspartate O-methyltransferase family protein n=1 Tax=Streptomyces sp. NPDC087226 TaxID=3365771 RepID=UPI0037F1E665